MTNRVTGIILAGGASRRMGRNKALLDWGGIPMIASIVQRLRTVADEIIIAANDKSLYAPFADRCVEDVFQNVGTLAGIHAGLKAAAHEVTLVVGCDMPFLNPAVLEWFVQASQNVDVVVLQRAGQLEPLHAVYRTSCLAVIEEAILAGERIAYSFYDRVRTRYVDPAEIDHLDPTLCSFRNVNTPEEWNRAVEWHYHDLKIPGTPPRPQNPVDDRGPRGE